MRKLFLAALLIFGVACKGPKGDKGDSGPGTVTTYTGVIFSDSQLIGVGAYADSSDISVFVGDGINYIECPYWAPSLNLNVYYAAAAPLVTIYNAKTAAATHYKIVVITSAASAGLSP